MASLATYTEILAESSVPSLEGLTPTEARSVILPYIFRFATDSPTPEHPRDVVVLVDLTNRSITFVEGTLDPEATFHEERPLPASKASIESMPVVRVLDVGTDCAICLSDFEIGGEAKEMPCGHRFHPICIDQWLGINGSCPTCRYKMPVDEVRGENDDKESGESDDEESGENDDEGSGENDDEESGGDERDDDDGGRQMGRVMFVFHVIVRQDTGHRGTSESAMELTSESSESEVQRGLVRRDSYEVLIGIFDHSESEAQDMITDNN